MRTTIRNFAFAAAVATLGVTGGILSAPVLFAQEGSELPGQPDPSRVAGGSYALDPVHTLVEWQVSHFGFNDYFGLFGDISGTLELDPNDIAASRFEIMVPIAEVTVASDDLKDHLLRPGKDGAEPDFFGPDPGMATFTSTNVRRVSDTSAVVSGMLEMNGRSGPVTMMVDLAGAGTNPMNEKETVGFHGRATIDRTDWGIDWGEGLIGSEVDLIISAAFEKQ
ncbi:MAG: YceI family protein [Erythrobacter sp.]